MKVGKWKLLLPLALLAVAALIGTSGALAKSNQSGEVKVAIMTDCKGAFAFGYDFDIGGAQGAFARYALSPLVGNLFDTGLAASLLVLGGVLERHPRLRIVLYLSLIHI